MTTDYKKLHKRQIIEWEKDLQKGIKKATKDHEKEILRAVKVAREEGFNRGYDRAIKDYKINQNKKAEEKT